MQLVNFLVDAFEAAGLADEDQAFALPGVLVTQVLLVS